ncbi:hypothetical protein NDU88_009293 [Pleurodeles waltl]|uniref:Uncharacterized protein n=1 Tax=Pleurodeles waltl TaxID=8319 RepID=A0AAV7PSW1_PLEWA|nr:hypothetical protein NDU88_009293 [Pleurodeles waltl]
MEEEDGNCSSLLDDVHTGFFKRLEQLLTMPVAHNTRSARPREGDNWFNRDCRLTRTKLISASSKKDVARVRTLRNLYKQTQNKARKDWEGER